MNSDKQNSAERIRKLEAALQDVEQSNSTLRTTGDWYRDTIEAAEVGTWVWDLSTGSLTWSDRCKAHFGLAPDDHVDYDVFLNCLYPDDRDRVNAAVQTAIRERSEYDTQSRCLLATGELRWLRFKGRAYVSDAGEVTRFQGIVININRQKAAEQGLRDALVQARESAERARHFEREAQSILESINEGFYGLDPDFRFTYLNASAEALLGRKRDVVIGRSLWEAFPEIVGTELETAYTTALREQRTIEVKTLFTPWNRWFVVRTYPSERGLAVYFREITQQKQLEVALLDTQERFELINNFIPVMVFTTRADGFHDYFNRRWIEYTGMTLEKTQGWGWSNLLHPDDRDRSVARWKHSLATGEPFEVEYRIRSTSDGTYRWFLGQALPVRDRDGKIVRWFGTCTDIMDRKRVEDDLAGARQSAEEASQAKSRFLASMSHELRTPLNAIIGYSEMLQEEVEDLGVSQLAPDLSRIYKAGKHLLSLISDILDLSKIEAGKMDIFTEKFDIAATVDEVVSTVQPLINQNNNRLGIHVTSGIGTMTSDLTRVRQTLFNLLSNASKFTSNGLIDVEVHPKDRGGQDFIVFQVRDTGIGIAPEKVSDLFEPFSQLHEKSVKAGGTGLGLAITKRFCEILGGDISVRSDPGKGSVFTIRLPRVAPQPVSQESAVNPEKRNASEMPRGRGLVLVVDDDASARDLMQRYLTREGYQTVLASSGEDGLRLARQIKPNVITLDVMMPGMDGWAVLQALKADPELSCIPVVMVTMMGDRSLGFALGASDFIAKPVTRENLSLLMARFRCAEPPCRVLIVDDDENSRSLVRTIFDKEGWLVDTAANGLEGLAAVNEHRPALILLDLVMPEMDGFEFTSQLRKNQAFRKIPIVVLTGKDITSEDRDRLNGSVEKYLSKGALSNDQVLNEVREILTACL